MNTESEAWSRAHLNIPSTQSNLNPRIPTPVNTTAPETETQDAQLVGWTHARFDPSGAQEIGDVPFGLNDSTQQHEFQAMNDLPIPAFESDRERYNNRPLSGTEPHFGGMFIQQQPCHLPQLAHVNSQLVDVLSPLVNNLRATGAFMGQMREDDEIGEMRRQHYDRAADMTPLMTGPTGEPVTYYSLRTSDPYLINSAARLQERHLQMAHDLRIINSADEMIESLITYRESAMRRMRDVDRDYGAIVEGLVEFVRGQPTVWGSGWYYDVSQSGEGPWADGSRG